MANKKISDLPAAGSVVETDLFEISTGGVSKSATAKNFADYAFNRAEPSLTFSVDNFTIGGPVGPKVEYTTDVLTVYDSTGNPALRSDLSAFVFILSLTPISGPQAILFVDDAGHYTLTSSNSGGGGPIDWLTWNDADFVASTAGGFKVNDILRVGAGHTNARAGGVIYTNVNEVGNVGGGVDTLMSYTVPGGTLGNDKEFIEFDAWGSFGNNNHNKQLIVSWEGNTIFDTGVVTYQARDWRCHGRLVRKDATTLRGTVEFVLSGSLLGASDLAVAQSVNISPDSLDATDEAFAVTGEDSNGTPLDNSIVQSGLVLKWYPAAA